MYTHIYCYILYALLLLFAKARIDFHNQIFFIISFLSSSYLSITTTMKNFRAVVIAAIVTGAAAINEPVASPTVAIEAEVAEFERQLGTDASGYPTETPRRPSGVSFFLFLSSRLH